MNSHNNLLEALKNIQVQKREELEYRVHYDDTGFIYMCSMQSHPENTKYLVVSKEEYDNYMRLCVKNETLVPIDRSRKHRVQLKSSDQGYCVVKNHAGIILEDNENYSTVEYYDTNS